MELDKIDAFIRECLGEYWIDDEYSRNGVQVEAGDDIERMAFAVDACQETIQAAREAGAQMLVVHHGLCWGAGIGRLDGLVARRVGLLFRHGISLYGCHLPLDAHPVLGNNATIARRLGLAVNGWFDESHGLSIGAVCPFQAPVDFAELADKATRAVSPRTKAYDNSGGRVKCLGILSGSGDSAVRECAERGIDCLLTGEFRHAAFNEARELGVSILACGHYDSEVFGVQELMRHLHAKLGLDVVFVEAPTGL